MSRATGMKSWRNHPAVAAAPTVTRPARKARRSQVAAGVGEDGFRIIHDGYYWQVEGPDGSLSVGFSSMAQADVWLGVLARAAKRRRETRVRPCMTCERAFTSEGIHNRMCPDCRQRGYPPATGW